MELYQGAIRSTELLTKSASKLESRMYSLSIKRSGLAGIGNYQNIMSGVASSKFNIK